MSSGRALGRFDIAICGGGLAGLTLARQLRRELPDLSVVLLDKQERPLPAAAFKVGESSVDPGGRYLADVIDLESYLLATHLEKFGLRLFYPPRDGSFASRPEVGRSRHNPAVKEYQLDRGVLEQDLRAMAADAGVMLVEGASVDDIELSGGEADHEVVYRDRDGVAARVTARWVVDATGRRRLLQKKLGHALDVASHYSACWFRVDRRIDVSELVPASETGWHARAACHNPHDPRYGRQNSTNHLFGDGYWVWLIPLTGDLTSVGIVADEHRQPFETFNTLERARAWLEDHEPYVAARVAQCRILDFKVMRRYSYSSRCVLSAERWACVGEAGAFSDPYWSNGMDIIGIGNSMTCEAIGLERAGALDPALCQAMNRELIDYIDLNRVTMQSAYDYFDSPRIAALKFIWDGLWFLSVHGPFTYNYVYRYRSRALVEDAEALALLHRIHDLQRTMIRLFGDWAARAPDRAAAGFDWIDYFVDIPAMGEVARRAVVPRLDPRSPPKPTAHEDMRADLRVCEEFAHAVFRLAIEDVLPDQAGRFERPLWLNAWAFSLDSARWQTDGLFTPTTPPGDSARHLDGLRALFARA